MITDFSILYLAVHDADAAAKGYQEMFGMHELMRADSDALHLHSRMLSCGNVRIDFLSPKPGNEWLPKILEAKGEGVYAIGLAVDDLDAAVKRVEGAGARAFPVGQLENGMRLFDVPAKYTHGVTVQLMHVPEGALPALTPGSGGTAVELTLHCILVRDMEGSVADWTRMFGTGVATVHEGEELGNKNTMVPLGSKGAHLEVMTPRTGKEDWAPMLEKRGESTFLIGIRVADMDAVVDHIRDTGRRVVGEFTSKTGGRQAMVHPKDANGVMIELLTPAPASV